MTVCRCCNRHVNDDEARCPFRECDQPRRRGPSYLVVAALSAGMAATQGCYGAPPPPRDDVRPRQPAERVDTTPVTSTDKNDKPR